MRKAAQTMAVSLEQLTAELEAERKKCRELEAAKLV